MNKNSTEKPSTQSNNSKKIDWIVTPGLKPVVDDFLQLYEELYDSSTGNSPHSRPLMICGDTGVGKSLFVKLFEQKFKENNPNSPVVKLNCAAIDTNLIISELFGYKKGAFTGADKDKKGLIEAADGGLLILEEIGELRKPGQARLLTFLEDGEYYKLGDTKPSYANVQIISTTHKPKNMFRDDFWNRFFQFFIPALYERRIDVLYYFYIFNRDILVSLRSNELLAVLTYNWPGNVREIENVSNLLSWKDKIRFQKIWRDKKIYNDLVYSCFFYRSNNKYSSLNFNFYNIPFIEKVRYSNINLNIDYLESFLTWNGLSPSASSLPFKENLQIKISVTKKLEIKYFDNCEILDSYDNAIKHLKLMFLRNLSLDHNENLLDINEKDGVSKWEAANMHFVNVDWDDNDFKFQIQIYEYRTGKKYQDRSRLQQKLTDDIEDDTCSEKEILKNIYSDRIKLYGNMKKAAGSLEIPYTTFRDRIIRDYPEINPQKLTK